MTENLNGKNRQAAVAIALLEGATGQQIGEQLGISRARVSVVWQQAVSTAIAGIESPEDKAFIAAGLTTLRADKARAIALFSRVFCGALERLKTRPIPFGEAPACWCVSKNGRLTHGPYKSETTARVSMVGMVNAATRSADSGVYEVVPMYSQEQVERIASTARLHPSRSHRTAHSL